MVSRWFSGRRKVVAKSGVALAWVVWVPWWWFGGGRSWLRVRSCWSSRSWWWLWLVVVVALAVLVVAAFGWLLLVLVVLGSVLLC